MRAASSGESGHVQPTSVAATMDAKALGCDPHLIQDMESLFASNSDWIVLIAHKVTRAKTETEDDSTGAQLLRALGATSFLTSTPDRQPTPAILCLTVRRPKPGRTGFSPALSVIKARNVENYEVRHTYPLKHLLELHVKPAAGSEDGTQEGGISVVHLRFSPAAAGKLAGAASPAQRRGAKGSAVNGPELDLKFKLASAVQYMAFLVAVVQLIRQAELQMPRITGIDQAELEMWWNRNKAALLAAVGEFGAEVLEPQSSQGEGSEARARVLVSTKEERELEELLDMFAMGLGDVAEFESRLADEYEALEAANVHSLLANVPLVDSVVFQLRKTAGMLEDIDETLQVFDTKLRHMREDISAIETHNNLLERTARNNARLLTTVKGLLSDVKVPREVREKLESPVFELRKLGAVTKPAWALHEKLQRLTPGTAKCLPTMLLNMSVVRHARSAMEGLAEVFVTRASAFLAAQLNQAVEELALEAGRSTDKAARIKPPDHSRLATLRSRTAELVRVLHALDPAALARLHASYASSLNLLLRKELRAASAELRKAAQLDAHSNPLEFALTKDGSSAARAAAAGATGSAYGGSDGASVVSDLSGPGAGGGGGGGGRVGSTISRNSRSTAHTTASIPLVMRARGGAFDGTSLALPLNEAYSTLVESWVPHLLEELIAAASYLLLYRQDVGGSTPAGGLDRTASTRQGRHGREVPDASGMDGGAGSVQRLSPEGKACLAALLAGIEPEFQVILELASKGQQVLCLPMLATTTYWVTQLMTPPPRPTARPLALLLAGCHGRLKSILSGWLTTQLGAVDAYGGKAQAGVKTFHVLPFTTQFALVSHLVENLLATATDAPALMEAQQQEQVALTAAATPMATARSRQLPSSMAVPPSLRLMLATSDDEDEDEEDDVRQGATSAKDGGKGNRSSRVSGSGAAVGTGGPSRDAQAQGERLLAAATWQCRAETDEVYQSIVGQMFNVLERMAAADAKHGERLRLENYTYFIESMRPLLRQVTALAPYMTQAETRQEESMHAYVQQQLEYGRLWRLLEFSERLDKLLEVVAPHEVSFQAGCSAAEVRALIKDTVKEADKKLSSMFGRVRKHLGTTTLAFRVWECIQEQLLIRYERLEAQVGECYEGQVELVPSPEELADLFSHVGTG